MTNLIKMKWYDRISKKYDIYTSSFYRKKRRELVDALEIEEGSRILIIACGTGQSFELLEERTGEKGEIVAVDYSGGMLEQAKRRIKKNGWKNIKLIQEDARKIDADYLRGENIEVDFDFVIGELAFSVIPEWKKVMKTSISLLNDNGKIGLLDWYRKNNDIITKIVDYLAEAETTRNTIEFARASTKEFRIIKQYFFKSVYIGVGGR